MRFLSAAAACLICTASFGQSPQPAGSPPSDVGPNQAPRPVPIPLQGSAITQNSRVRAFNAGPDGQVRSIYLTNGSVVDVSSGFGPGFSSQIRKGTRIRIVGSRTVINGQSIVTPQELTIGQQSFAAQPNLGSNRQAGLMRPPNGGSGMPPPPGGDRGPRGPRGGPMRAGMTPPPPPGAGGPGMTSQRPPARPNGPMQPPPVGHGLRNQVGPGQQPGNTPGKVPPPPSNGTQPASGGPPQSPAPMDSTQPASAPPPAPNR